ncbi:MAG: molecular chaperone DnaJ [Gemmatimonadales bacterium]|jgi:molecular chaperone DnaJ|nr:molecular chaperone DnaJ [Gemmatimonadales bacterium]
MSEFYRLLGVERDASEADIKKAYRKAAMEWHPDRNRSPEAEARFKEITEAYEVLRDPEQRAAYDRYGKAGVGRGGTGGFNYHHVDLSEALNIFMRDFGGFPGFEQMFGGQRAQGEARRGQDIRVTVKLTLAEVHTGVKKTVKLKTLERCGTCNGSGARAGSQPQRCATCAGSGEVRRAARSVFGQFVSVSACPTCGGEGEIITQACEVCRGDGRVRGDRSVAVEIPPGVSSNNYLTLRGQGAVGARGGPSGDLVVMIEVKDDERFERNGDDLIHTLAISFSQAALGAEVVVPTAIGEEGLRIQPGTQSGSVVRLKGRGLPRLGQNGFGDLHVRVHVWTPDRLTDEQERLLRQLGELEGSPPQQSHSFWSRIKEVLGA